METDLWGKSMLSIKRLLYIVLIVVALGGIFIFFSIFAGRPAGTGSQRAPAPEVEFLETVQVDEGDKPKVWLLGNSEEEPYGTIYANVKTLCNDIQILLAGEGTLDGATEGDIVMICSPSVSAYADPQELEGFIAKGGRVILAAGLEDRDSGLLKVFGIRKSSSGDVSNELVFEKPLLPIQPEEAACDAGCACARIEVNDDASVYIRDKESGVPVLYTYPWQEGCVCLINGTFLKDMRYMGMLTGAIGALLPDFLYPVLGVKTAALDNFLAGSVESDEFCSQVYGYSAVGFVRDVVWPAFQGISLRTNTPYTVCTKEDSVFVEAVGRSILQFGGELAYTGSGREDALDLFPVSTRGNFLEDGGFLSAYSVLGAYGTVAHAFDIDGLITADGGASWDKVKKELGAFESEILARTAWLEGRTLSQVEDIFKSYRSMDYGWTKSGDSIELSCSSAAKGQAFFCHTESSIIDARGLTFEDLGNGYYLLRVQENHGSITLGK